uniref:Uncharacterized protein n=1 Tax=Clandestinovirus TaxID=2831644 RepID=A0A8F8KQ69_9VIRU|nr:hypothetical protein KOM_12_507 [Clandestinovirus]
MSDCYTLRDAMTALKKTLEQLLKDVWLVIQDQNGHAFAPLYQFVAMSFTPHMTPYNVNMITQVNEPVCLQAAIANFLANYSANEKPMDTLAIQRELEEIFSPCETFTPLQPHVPFQAHSSEINYQVPQDPTRLHEYFIANPSPYQAEFPTHPSVNVVARFVPTFTKDLISSMMTNEKPWFPKLM